MSTRVPRRALAASLNAATSSTKVRLPWAERAPATPASVRVSGGASPAVSGGASSGDGACG